jgi:hypothetical protein
MANPSRLRDVIDRGRTGDKVRVADPALAPLGTDEEAAGTPPSPTAVAAALREETARPHHAPEPRIGGAWVLFAVIAFLAAGILAWPLIAP